MPGGNFKVLHLYKTYSMKFINKNLFCIMNYVL